MTVVGTLPTVGEGQMLELKGSYGSHPRFGTQFRAESYEVAMPQNDDNIARYLASGLFEGIGPQTAARIAGHFGAETFEIIENNPKRLCEIKGITLKKANAVSTKYRRLIEIKPIILFFQSHGFSARNAMDAYLEFGAQTINLVRANPYLLMNDGIGINFKRCDALAFEIGFEQNDVLRIEASLRYVLIHNLGNGHTFLPREKLLAACSSMAGVELSDVGAACERLIEKGVLASDEKIGGCDAVYLADYYAAECLIAGSVASMAAGKALNIDVSPFIAETERVGKMIFNDAQKTAVSVCINNRISVLNGGPGTGKTTSLLCIINALEKLEKKFFLAAPTGRAAKRIEELTGREARTVHRLLELEYSGKGKYTFGRNEENKLKGDYLIIDEASMADVMLMAAVFKAMPENMSLILVGDANQLPPVGAGNFFGNIVSCGVVKVNTLTEIFRQAAESGIIIGAHEIIAGRMPDLGNSSRDFFFMARASETDVCQTVADLCSRRLPDKYGFSPLDDIQVIAPTRLTRCGTEYLNAVLQTALNGENKENESLVFGSRIFARGDKVMQTENDYEIVWTRENGEAGTGLYNGDIGIIVSVNREMRTVAVCFDGKTAVYGFDMLAELEPAYAVTVHKSQGCEFRAVIIPVFDAPRQLLNRCLLYTAVTRAKELLIFVGKRDTVAAMVENGRANISYCGLKYLIRRAAGLEKGD